MSFRIEFPIVWKIAMLFTAFIFSVPVLIVSTALFTRFRYKYQLSRLSSNSEEKRTILKAPQIPYYIPFLGNALEFLRPKPGQFWKVLFRTHPRSTGACTLLLGGETTHILFDPTALLALFKERKPNRDKFNDQLVMNSLGLSRAEVSRLYGQDEPSPKYDENGKDVSAKKRQDDIWHEFLMKTENVNELMTEFRRLFQGSVDEDERLKNNKALEIGITEWMRSHMFSASAVALLGSKVLEVYPELVDDFWPFDTAILALFFGLPKAMVRKEHEAADRIISGMQKWHEVAKIETAGTPMDPSGPTAWEPCYGARVTRARQYFYKERKLSERSRAALDAGFLFGLASNAIPTACWMLMHILDSKSDYSLHKRVMEELRTTKNENGSLNVSKVTALPLFQAVFNEVLRLYTDVLVSRYLPEDLVLPFDNGRSKMAFDKGSMILAPSYINHHDTSFWEDSFSDAPCNIFYPDRFLMTNPETGVNTFSTAGTAGKFFPFGGGRTICPGRIFAKQEVMASVALLLLEFDIEVLNYTDLEGNLTETFPEMKDSYQGSGIVAMNGDVKVRMKRKV
jgi:hypothetical protein